MPQQVKVPKIRISNRRGTHYVLNFRFEGRRFEKWIGPISPEVLAEAEAAKKAIEFQIKRGDFARIVEAERKAKADASQQREAEVVADRFEALTFEVLAEQYEVGYVESPKAGRNGRGLKDQRNAKLRIRQLVEHFGERPVKTIDQEAIEAWANRRARVVSGGTVNRTLALLSHLYNWAIDSGKLPEGWRNPVKGIRRFLEAEPADEFFQSEAEAEAVLGHCPEVLRKIVTLGRNTGMRRSELLSVKWSQINRRSRMIMLPGDATKNGHARPVPLNDTALAVIDSLPRAIKDGPIFVHPDGRPVLADWVTKRFAKALKASNITSVRRFYGATRHDAASQLVMAGRSLEQVGRVLGHRSPAMTKRYAHLSEEHLLDVTRTLDKKSAAKSDNQGVNQGVKEA